MGNLNFFKYMESFINMVRKLVKPLGLQVIPVGSYRRKSPNIKDLDLILLARANSTFQLEKWVPPPSWKVVKQGPRAARFGVHNVVFVDMFLVYTPELAAAKFHYTGPKSYNIRIRKYAKDKGYILNQYGLFKLNKKGEPSLTPIPTASEQAICKLLGVTYYEPPDRK